MARPRLPGTAPVIPSNSLVASAARYDARTGRVRDASKRSWQDECYRHFYICGEARFAATFFGHALSRAKLRIAPENTSARAEQMLEELFNGPNGQAQMLNSIGIHLTIAGECYLVGRKVTAIEQGETGSELWEIVSVQEIKVTGQKWFINYSDDTPDIPLADDDVIIRIWTPSPSKRIEADSPFRSLLPVLQEIERVTAAIFSQSSSQLTGGGLLLLPHGISFPPPLDVNGKAVEYANEADGFMLTLADLMMDAMNNPNSMAARTPLIASLPADAIDKVKLIHFWSELDAIALETRSAAIQRFALGMDLPPEQVLGMSSNEGTGGGTSNGVSHWGAWQIEESTIKMHVEPMLETVDNALSVGYIRPVTGGRETVIADTTDLRLRPDRSQESIELHDRGILKAEVVVTENGFEVEDMMDDQEYKGWLLHKVASGSATPEQVQAALKMLGVDLPVEPGQGEVRESRPAPSLEDHPGRDLPEAASLALIAASEGLVYRALEKAGNRVLNAGKRGKDRTTQVLPYEAHLHEEVNGQGVELLRDAFTCAPQVLDGLADPNKVIPVLERYCLGLFTDRAPHSRDRLATALEKGLA